MWICPKCGRAFSRQNQGHYCGKAPADLNEYIAVQDERCRKPLRELADMILAAAPDCTVEIKWSMPSFKGRAGAIQLAANKKQISLYVGADVIEQFQEAIGDLKYKKDAIYLPYDGGMPEETIRRIVKHVLLG